MVTETLFRRRQFALRYGHSSLGGPTKCQAKSVDPHRHCPADRVQFDHSINLNSGLELPLSRSAVFSGGLMSLSRRAEGESIDPTGGR